METCCVNDDRIWAIWNWCSDAYLRNGQRLKLPANTDPTRTYQWRYVKSIAERFVEWEFDDDTCRKFIDIAVDYANKRGVIRKGLAVLHQSNMLDICYKMLLEEKNTVRQSQDSLDMVHKWFRMQIGNRNPIQVLLQRPQVGAMCNITQWYRARKISDQYLAISRSCCRALARLEKIDSVERSMLPKATKLYSLRSEMSKDLKTFKSARRLLGNDWRELCQ
jgi:hypothetical protein